MFREKIKPTLVLTLICLIACALLVTAYEATYVDSTGIITEKMADGLAGIYGSPDGFTMMKDDSGKVIAPGGTDSVLTDENGNTAFEITADGYSGGGLHVLVGMDANGAVKGVSILTIGETPGLGTRVQNASFLDQFTGLTADKLPPAASGSDNSPKKYVWWNGDPTTMYELIAKNSSSAGNYFELDAVTGATLSSNGMYNAVSTALRAYTEIKGGSVQ